jgi:hypothetical protein
MLILDKSRVLDLMVAQASRAPVPEEFSLEPGDVGHPYGGRTGFRVAVYGPLGATHDFDEAQRSQAAPPLPALAPRTPSMVPAIP